MALKLLITYKGIEADYWKIYKIESDILGDLTIARLSLYKDAATRQEDIENVINTRGFELKGVDYTRTDIYTKMKETEEWAKAEDC